MRHGLRRRRGPCHTPPVRTGFVVHQFLPRHHTGTEQYVRALAREARRRGHDARVFTVEPTASFRVAARLRVDDEVEGIPVHRFAVARSAVANPVLGDHDQPLVAAELRRWLDAFAPEALHAFHLQGIGAAALADAARRGIPVLAHATDFWSACPVATLTLPDGTPCEGPPDGGLGCFQCAHSGVAQVLATESLAGDVRRARDLAGALRMHRPLLPAMALAFAGRREEIVAGLHSARAVVAPSRFLRDALLRHGVRDETLALVPYGLDLDRLGGLADRASGPVVFGFFGTVAPHKGAVLLARAFTRVPGDVRLVVRGRLDEFPAYGEELAAAARNDPRIELAGPFAPADLGAALSAIDVLVVPSLWHENTPFVALEALAARRPVVASDRGGLAESVAAGRGGALVPAGDASALAAALGRWSDRTAVERARAEIAPARTIADAHDDLARLLQEGPGGGLVGSRGGGLRAPIR